MLGFSKGEKEEMNSFESFWMIRKGVFLCRVCNKEFSTEEFVKHKCDKK